MFGMATMTLGIGPHSSCYLFSVGDCIELEESFKWITAVKFRVRA